MANSRLSTYPVTLLGVLLFAQLGLPAAHAQGDDSKSNNTVRWYGMLDAEVRMFRFEIEVTETESTWSGILRSLDEGKREFPLDHVAVSPSGFEFEIKATGARFEGKIANEGARVVGKWKQGGADLDLTLDKVEQFPTEDLQARWVGKLSVLFQKLDVAFRQLKSGEVYFDSLTQNAGGFIANMKIDGRQVEFDVPAVRGTFQGEYNADQTEIIGKWSQGFISVELVLRKAEGAESEIATLNRPQMPQAPFPYEVRDVTFHNDLAEIDLAGTLTIPKSDVAGAIRDVPAVVLISGSGPQDRDESIMEHKPFWVIADFLSRHGIAVLRFDDRGVGKSQGTFATATSADFATDVQAAVAFLRDQDGIDAKRIGLCGHSEGGIIAPMVAATDPKIAFVILLAGTGVNGEQILLSQGRLLLEAAGASEQEMMNQRAIQEVFIRLAKQQPSISQDEFLAEATVAIEPFLSDEEKQQAEQIVQAAGTQILSPWFRFFITHEPASDLKKLTCPVLVVNGGKDLQVDPKLNLPAIKTALEEGGVSEFQIKELPGLNHLFQNCTTGSVSEYQEIEETISVQVLELLNEWIHARFP